MKYEDKGDYLLDTTTGLGWEKWVRDGDPQQTVDSVNSAMVGGRGDWRVPTIHELETLPDLNRMNPAMDPAFTIVLPGSYRSSTPSQRAPSMYIWAISSIDGRSVAEQPRADTHMRLVCGSWAPQPLVVVDDTTAQQGTVLWKRYPEAAHMTPQEAIAFAAQDRTGGRTWRLPTVQEALHRIDKSLKTYPALDPSVFPTVPQEPVWTATPARDVGSNGFFWAVDPYGTQTPYDPRFNQVVWLVSDTTAMVAPAPAPVVTPVPTPTPAPTPAPTPTSDSLISRNYVRALLTELLNKI